MKIRIDISEEITEDEVIIKSSSLTPEIMQLQELIKQAMEKKNNIVFYKGDTRVYFPLEEILFFETDQDGISAHTASDCYQIKYRLYELEDLLPRYFMRISKSTILNTKKIFSIDKNIYASSSVTFRDTHKQVFVSRHYYKPLIELMEDRRNTV